jgi:disulfide oxidoreductase YuzD
MTLNVTGDYTKAYFDRIVFMNDTYLYPFVTVRSMYVEEGNTSTALDADYSTTDAVSRNQYLYLL